MSYTEEILDFQEQERHENPELHLASGGQRFANYMIDSILMNVLFSGLGFIIEAVNIDFTGVEELSVLSLIVLLILVLLSYWVIFEGRTLCRYIPFEPFSFLGNKPIGWHDSLSKTLVVKDTYNVRDEYL